MAGCSIINYKGKEVIYGDHHGLSGPELLENLKLTVQTGMGYQGKEVLLLGNFTDTVVSDEAMNYLKTADALEVNKKYKKIAIFGVTGLKKVLLTIYNTISGDKSKAFNTEEEAKEYLVK